MKISVIIPTYKPQGYIWECLDSLVAQTFPKKEFEVILVLNGCKEPYNTQIREYIAKHPSLNINFIQTDQGGVSNARNIALDLAKGEYITFIDDDDYVSPSYLEELYAKASPDTISLCYPYAFNDGKPKIQLSYGFTYIYNKLAILGLQPYPKSRKFFSGPCMKLIPMQFIHGKKFDIRFKNGEDSLYMFLISNKYRFVDYTSKNAVYYRRVRDNSATTNNRSYTSVFRNSCSLISEYTKIYIKSPLSYNFLFYLTRVLGACKAIIYTQKDTF